MTKRWLASVSLLLGIWLLFACVSYPSVDVVVYTQSVQQRDALSEDLAKLFRQLRFVPLDEARRLRWVRSGEANTSAAFYLELSLEQDGLFIRLVANHGELSRLRFITETIESFLDERYPAIPKEVRVFKQRRPYRI